MENIALKKVPGDTREEYYQQQAIQYLKALGIEKLETLPKTFSEDLSKWQIERNKTKSNYIDLLNYLEINYDIPFYDMHKIAELRKGVYDTITTKNTQTTMITPYTFGLTPRNGKILKSDIILTSDSNKDISTNSTLKEINTFLSHNPYSDEELLIWLNLHNKYNFGIIAGVYGNVYDKDREEKLKNLAILKEYLKNVTTEEYVTIRDDYMYVLSAPPVQKEYTKKYKKTFSRW